MSVANPVAQRGISLSLGTEDASIATDEPPDIGTLQINEPKRVGPTKSNTLSNIPISEFDRAARPTHINVPLLSTSLDTSLRRATASAETIAKLSPIMPHSPSVAESTGGSASDYEHEPDSPSSMSSWNSWAGGRRGDLADVEDLELDGVTMGEPELETVSEMDEESSGFVSGSDRQVNESEDDDALHRQSTRNQNHFNPAEHSPRRKIYRQLADGHGHGISPHYAHHASHLHPHGTPIHPHFSPRAGGNGLSHASRHLLRAPPNLAARRRHHHKGRLAELAEEGAGGAITTTKMPVSNPSDERQSSSNEGSGNSSREGSPTDDNQISPKEGVAPALPASVSLPPVDIHQANHASPDHMEMEIFGPPALPVRSVSPSETIPVVPSPLCVCLTADEKGDVTEVRQDLTPTNEVEMEGVSMDTPTAEIDSNLPSGLRTPTPPSPTTSSQSAGTFVSASTPTTSPSLSPQLTRKSSGRARRASSPSRSKTKVPLRPCFKRHGTSSRFYSSNNSSAAASGRDSSSEREKLSSRGRTKVRFQQGPPMEIRTHSPVEYDRKACPISNRLSAEDLEELRTMKMEMGLLEAKCAALAAYKADGGRKNPGLHYSATQHGGDWTESESESESSLHPSSYHSPLADRRRADSISSSSPTTFCGNRFAQRSNVNDDGLNRMTPAEYLRMEREKERERVCRLAGIGTGVGFRYTGGSPNTRQMPHGGCEAFGASSIISRFGLSKPPPPLPGMVTPCNSHQSIGSVSPQPPSPGSHAQYSPSGYQGGSGLYRPNSAPPVRGAGYSGTGNAFPQGSDVHRNDELREVNEEDNSQTHYPEHDDTPRGRSMEKSNGRNLNHNSTSTDATVTEFKIQDGLPSLMETGPSPPSSMASHSPIRDRSMSPCTTRYDPSFFYGKPSRPGIRPVIGATSSPSYELVPTPSTCGYDSPASEFCYESGSEYDLIG